MWTGMEMFLNKWWGFPSLLRKTQYIFSSFCFSNTDYTDYYSEIPASHLVLKVPAINDVWSIVAQR